MSLSQIITAVLQNYEVKQQMVEIITNKVYSIFNQSFNGSGYINDSTFFSTTATTAATNAFSSTTATTAATNAFSSTAAVVFSDALPRSNSSPSSKKTPFTVEYLRAKKAVELKKLCTISGYRSTGTKDELISRLMMTSTEKPKNIIHKPMKLRLTSGMQQFINNLENKHYLTIATVPFKETQVYDHNKGTTVTYLTYRGLVYHPQTRLFYARLENVVHGNQTFSQLKELDRQSVDICIENNLPYEIPENLNKGYKGSIAEEISEELGPEEWNDEASDDEHDEGFDMVEEEIVVD